ncbi:DUF1810 domain-containing protein [Noviherbaspirillum sp.]|uniref:DUF1810 domain-containing protein n=1 Tax=Noviherbaspirillum sp. TaxID=1926288 RepID=UPI002FE3E13B
MNDEFNLQRFIDAQDPLYDRVRAELRAGRKQSHWMWFVFPQIEGLGHSATARTFAIASLAEAAAYLRHPLLGKRLRECAALVAAVENRTIAEIFGYPDDMKFHSSMTLFAHAAPEEAVFRECLDKYFAGKRDSLTLARLGV